MPVGADEILFSPQRDVSHEAWYESRVTAAEYRHAIDVLPYGKRLPGAVYLIDPGDDTRIPSLLRVTVAELRRRMDIGAEFNLLKLHTASPKVSFLAYPDFEIHPHPALAEAVIVDLVTGKIRRDDYRARANPPILHRKETFVPPEHPLHEKFAKLTRQEEAAGLLIDTARIGFRLNWERLLADKGLGFEGHRLVEIEHEPRSQATPKKKIQRHKTALVRREISKPVKTLLELGQLRHGESFFDYGCGHGGDVDAIRKLGHPSGGWDPVHAPDAPKQSADAVNLGFVLNVIEDPAERVEALLDAWHHTRRVLLVSTLIGGDFAGFGVLLADFAIEFVEHADNDRADAVMVQAGAVIAGVRHDVAGDAVNIPTGFQQGAGVAFQFVFIRQVHGAVGRRVVRSDILLPAAPPRRLSRTIRTPVRTIISCHFACCSSVGILIVRASILPGMAAKSATFRMPRYQP
jgi:hypothetical protein